MNYSQQIPEPSVIREKALEIVQGEEYQLESLSRSDDTYLLELFLRFFRWIGDIFRFLDGLLGGLPAGFRWAIIIALVVVLTLVIMHMINTIILMVKKAGGSGQYKLTSESNRPRPEIYEQEAEKYVNSGDYISAIRSLFLACLLRLENHEKKTFPRGMTNRQHLRRFQGTPVYDSFRKIVDVIDIKWYGEGECHEYDFITCKEAHHDIYSYTQG